MYYDIALDGISHINIYSKGRTALGRILSNFYKYPIITDDGQFMSVEGYWYWLSIEDCKEKEKLRQLSGVAAKIAGKQLLLTKSRRWEDNFETKISKAIWYKFRRHADLVTQENYRLPLVHYYAYNGKVKDVTEKYQWMIDNITKMRDYIARKKGYLE